MRPGPPRQARGRAASGPLLGRELRRPFAGRPPPQMFGKNPRPSARRWRAACVLCDRRRPQNDICSLAWSSTPVLLRLRAVPRPAAAAPRPHLAAAAASRGPRPGGRRPARWRSRVAPARAAARRARRRAGGLVVAATGPGAEPSRQERRRSPRRPRANARAKPRRGRRARLARAPSRPLARRRGRVSARRRRLPARGLPGPPPRAASQKHNSTFRL